MFIDDAYAHLCSLSRAGLGGTYPNPNVAAGIYSADGKLIADGFHNRAQSADHAEVVALKKAGAAARGATMVISLEPCAHTGTTPPCAQAIIDAGISQVVYAITDPNPIAAGGAQLLTAAGITVEQRKSAELEFIQRAWLTKQLLGRPLMIWKVAMTLDSKVAASDGTSQWISGPESRDDVQVLRAQSDAIVIGTNTAIIDNPHLVPRGHAARPVRIVCGEQVVPPTHNVFDEQARTITVKSKSIPELMKVLSDEGFNQVLVEAGPTLGSALMATGNIDELIIYQAPKLLGAGKEFVSHLGISTLADHIGLELILAAQFGSDTKSHYRIVKGR
ncbi:diaminohydroxyphosphoribosylaminopyrimidine deaminase / 5-amino-6-(5-phosphoribosylamino)uracil reductase [Candidatus Planktophila versatilis]|uniref:bifunctional diaminohydroxyphosphoribosylaminopyrimidine deaminase/5-amino-6-(5-phosphoribosylamino)uracil reductase RibD n=1 Tax=Candidatus Planktophila versatilis TaxID=1884905 RepID=UPI000BAC646F|nr:bifunctional diaminohydroxyphosphoribosylaminopyrimidine deaminase/5-amino-6-(5-phosphoribosylamino)uracil reductase RibD [Candidatus Planktophila versatilis]ASY18378.1 diaminohydroxyphosphoribosylaminopyrimidine deaminase / 5-amino-6-(5-phosphoribosylamino)uracil reductase [Candidatus Planktophila versatilis]